MVMVTVEPAVIPMIVNEKKPWGKLKPESVPHGVEVAAVRLVIEPLLVVKMAVPVPVAVLTFWVGDSTINPLVPVPPRVVTETVLVPGVASAAIMILAVIWVSLFTVKLVVVMPDPKLTTVAPVRLVPVIITLLSV